MEITQAGKGDTPRPVNKTKYDRNYESIFGKDCVCKGKGYHWDTDKTGKVFKTTCLICNGTGRRKT